MLAVCTANQQPVSLPMHNASRLGYVLDLALLLQLYISALTTQFKCGFFFFFLIW